MDFVTKNDFYRIAEIALLGAQPKLTRLAAETPGSDTHALLQGMAAVGDALMGQAISIAAGYYLTSSRGQKLDYRLLDHIGLRRKQAAVALCSVDFETTAVTVADFTIPHDTVLASGDGIQWATTHDAVFPKGGVGPLTVRIRSQLAGKDQYALPNTITSIVGTIVGAPADLRVNNPKASTIGDEEQNDDDYRTDGHLFFGAVRRGTLEAIEARALRVPGVKTAKATEVLTSFGLPQRTVLLGITDRFTELLINQTTVPPLYETQSRVLAQVVYDALSDTRVGGGPVIVELASVVIQPITLNLSFSAGADINDVAYKTRVAVVNAVNRLRRGDTLAITSLSNVIRQVRGISFTGNEIAYPIGDVVPKALQVLRTSLANVQANSLQPDRPLTLSVNADSFA